jgi:AraC-like DNA-binding protein
MVFHLADLQFPVIGYNQELNSVFRKLLNDELLKHQSGESFTEKLRQVILKNYRSAFPQLEELSFYLNMTPRTLQRKLHDENSSFRVLSDSIKLELAMNLLLNESLSIADIAYKLGYADAGSFRKAFRNWTGKNPLQYKNDSTESRTRNAT